MRSFLNVDFEEFLKSSQVKSSQVKSLYGNAKPIQADDGSGRGPARGLLRWAKVSVGSGDRRCRASTALVDRARPFSDEFWRFGPDKGTSIDFGQATWAAGAAAAKEWSRSTAVRATHPTLHFLRMRARSRHTGVASIKASMAVREADGWQEQQREGCL